MKNLSNWYCLSDISWQYARNLFQVIDQHKSKQNWMSRSYILIDPHIKKQPDKPLSKYLH